MPSSLFQTQPVCCRFDLNYLSLNTQNSFDLKRQQLNLATFDHIPNVIPNIHRGVFPSKTKAMEESQPARLINNMCVFFCQVPLKASYTPQSP